MNSRTWLLVGTLLVAPAWAEEPATSPLPRLAFDLRSDSLKKIVRDTAATQYTPVQVSEEKPAKHEPSTVVFVPPEKVAKPAAHKVSLPAPVPRSRNFLSALLDIALDNEFDERTVCPSDEDLKTLALGYEHCPGVNGRLGFVAPIK